MSYSLPRRVLLQSLGAGATAVAAAGGGRRQQSFDFSDATNATVAFTRMRGDISGRRVFTYTRGRLYVVRPGEPAAPFLGYESGLIDEYREQARGVYRQTRRELLHFLDLHSSVLAERVLNPITGRRDRPINGLVGPLQFVVTPGGIVYNSHDVTAKPERSLALLWESRPGSTVATMETLRRYRNTQQPEEWPTASTGEYRCYEDFLSYSVANTDLQSRRSGVPAQLFYSGQTDLQPWMFVGRAPGHNLWHATGFKTTRFDDLPRAFVELTNKLHPGLWDDPFGYTELVRSYEDQLRERLAEHS
jgi:hypothetical protein